MEETTQDDPSAERTSDPEKPKDENHVNDAQSELQGTAPVPNPPTVHSTQEAEYQSDDRQSGSRGAPTPRADQRLGLFFSVNFVGSIESGSFRSINDVYIKYTILAGPDWVVSSGSDVGITQISRYRETESLRRFVWNQPIALSYRSYNYYGWPQIVISAYNFDTFGNDQILGYGCAHLPISQRRSSDSKQIVHIHSPQSSSLVRRVLSWLTGRNPELIDSSLFARGDCRNLLQMVTVGQVEISFNLTTKDATNNGYRSNSEGYN